MNMSSPEVQPPCGDLSMLQRCETFDWAGGPLGARDGWSPQLRTLVRVAMASSFPTLIVWGSELTMIYNDAYRPLIGAKHPQAFGKAAREVFAEIWSVVGRLFSQVLATGKSVEGEDTEFLVERHGFLEETYFTFSYAPIQDEHGVVQGIFVTCLETTLKVVSERRMRVLSELAEAVSQSDSPPAAWRGIRGVFERNPLPLPFALLYLRRVPEGAMELVLQAGLPLGHAAAPATIAAAGWPFGRHTTIGRRELCEDLHLGGATLTDSHGDTIRAAMAIPLSTPRGKGLLVLGVSPRREFDENYRRFFDLVAQQVESAIARAAKHEHERRRAEEALRRVRQPLETIFRAAPVAFVSVNHAGHVTNWSASATRMFGWTAADAIGRFPPLVPADEIEDFRERVKAIMASGASGLTVVRPRVKKNGQRFIASISSAPLLDARSQPVGVLAVIEDITERENARKAIQSYSARLSRLSQQLLDAQETERRHIARELHDEVGQSISLLKLHLEQVSRATPREDLSMRRAREGIERLLQTIRQICLQLRPALLDDLGLLPALLGHVDRFNEQNRTRCVFRHEGLKGRRFSSQIETAVFRIVQEALTNCVRHSGSSSVEVMVWADGDLLQARIADTGAGFELGPALARGASSGLTGMFERAKLAGGELHVHTSPGAGTCLTLELPLRCEPLLSHEA